MIDPNVAYTNEYKRYREEYGPVFEPKYRDGEINEIRLPDGSHTIRITQYTDNNNIVRPYRTTASTLEILNSEGLNIAEFKSIYHTGLQSFIEHENGRDYLVFSIDLYGYSVFDLSDYNHVHYVPESSFSKCQETFIWTNVLYSPRINLIAVDGCFWAGPSQTGFFDFSRPMELPFEKLCSTNDMEDQFDVGYDVVPIEWNDDGTITLENDTENGIFMKDIDVLSYKASP